MYSTGHTRSTVQYCTVQYCTVLYCTVLCTVLYLPAYLPLFDMGQGYLGGPVFALLPEWPKVISFSLLSASSVRCMCDHERRRGAPVPAALCPNNSRAECGLRSASSTARQGCVYALNVPHIARRVMQEDLCAGHTMAHGHRNVPDPNCPEPQALSRFV